MRVVVLDPKRPRELPAVVSRYGFVRAYSIIQTAAREKRSVVFLIGGLDESEAARRIRKIMVFGPDDKDLEQAF